MAAAWLLNLIPAIVSGAAGMAASAGAGELTKRGIDRYQRNQFRKRYRRDYQRYGDNYHRRRYS